MSQPESRLQRKIQVAAKARGAFVFKIHGGPTMMVGLPDLIMCYRGQFVAMEVKMPDGVTSKIQERRHAEIDDAGGHAFVVRSVQDAERALDKVDEVLDTEDEYDAADA